jgi:hypothetical protein
VEELIADVENSSIGVSFSLCGAIPKKILNLISKAHKELDFLVYCISEEGNRGKKFLIKNGKEVEKFFPTNEEICNSIYAFRTTYGIKWISGIANRNDVDRSVEMNKTGRAFLKGTKIAVRFALRRLIDGESTERLSERIPELNHIHLELLDSLVKNKLLSKSI